ncbi:hypothetical protein DS513_18175 [Salmonella enterica subsp. enterica serovar Sandiego]|nr:hypothetical protein [Salmonella enterica subsp. enterica serovar Sandiego]
MIKAGNGTMKTRDDRPSFALSCRLNLPALLRWLLMVFVLAGPGYAYAAPVIQCTSNGSGVVQLKLPPSVSFTTANAPPPGTVLYTGPAYTIPYECDYSSAGSYPLQVVLGIVDASGGGNLEILTDTLKKAHLKLEILLSDSSGGGEVTWEPSSVKQFVNFGAVYYLHTSPRTVSIRLRLTTTDKIAPGLYIMPPLSLFKIYAHRSTITEPGITLGTPMVRIQYIPVCFVQTRLSTNSISFGPVITTDVNNSLDLRTPFFVTSVTDENCAPDSNLLKPYTVNIPGEPQNLYYLILPLKVSFILNSGGEISGDGKSIELYKEGTTDKNGLQLKINGPDNKQVTFSHTETSSPDNKFDTLNGGNASDAKLTSTRTYTAMLSATGDTVRTGKYRAQVTVKVNFY